MPDWLQNSLSSEIEFSWTSLAVRQLAALALGCIVALIYRLTSTPAPHSRSLMATLVLLTVLIGMVTSVIGESVARAFSLVGALSIVRFRTVVEDTRDTAFVIFAVAVGMAAGSAYFKVPLVGIPVAAVAAFLFRSASPKAAAAAALALPADFLLTIRTGPSPAADGPLNKAFQTHLEASTLAGLATVRQGAALERTYSVRMRSEAAAAPLIAELNAIEGVQSVELRRA